MNSSPPQTDFNWPTLINCIRLTATKLYTCTFVILAGLCLAHRVSFSPCTCPVNTVPIVPATIPGHSYGNCTPAPSRSRTTTTPSHFFSKRSLVLHFVHVLLQLVIIKIRLYQVSSQQFTCVPTNEGKEIYATHWREVLCSTAHSDVTNLAPCCHEEARHMVASACVRCCAEGE